MTRPLPARRSPRLALLLLAVGIAAFFHPACALRRGQQYHHFTIATPLAERNVLILGFLGGRDSYDDPRPGVARLASRLRSVAGPDVHIEVVENRKRSLALRLVQAVLDRNRDGALDPAEKESARIVLYGQSFGGAAVVKFAHQLNELGIPVWLTVQVDSVGLGDDEIPPNVACAANLFQDDGRFIHGEPAIRPADPSRTRIVANLDYDYRDRTVDISRVPWYKKIFRSAHTKMDRDPQVWSAVEALILDSLHFGCLGPEGSA